MLTTAQKNQWIDRFTDDEWSAVMSAKMFPAVTSALTEGDLSKAERIMRDTLNRFPPVSDNQN